MRSIQTCLLVLLSPLNTELTPKRRHFSWKLLSHVLEEEFPSPQWNYIRADTESRVCYLKPPDASFSRSLTHSSSVAPGDKLFFWLKSLTYEHLGGARTPSWMIWKAVAEIHQHHPLLCPKVLGQPLLRFLTREMLHTICFYLLVSIWQPHHPCLERDSRLKAPLITNNDIYKDTQPGLHAMFATFVNLLKSQKSLLFLQNNKHSVIISRTHR